MNPLPEFTEKHLEQFEKKGWLVLHNNYYLGLTGYTIQNGKKEPRKERIVAIYTCNLVSNDGSIKKNQWEVTTHWTFKRNLFPEFEPAWQMFLDEEKKYNPKRIKWSQLNSQKSNQED